MQTRPPDVRTADTGRTSQPPAVGRLAEPRREGREIPLRGILVALDVVAALLGWAAATLVAGSDYLPVASAAGRLAVAVTAAAVTLMWVASQRLYLARVCAVHAVEVQRIGRASVLSVLVLFTLKELFNVGIGGRVLLTGAAFSGLMLVIFRFAYRNWVVGRRRRGILMRSIVVIGTNHDADDLVQALDEHPEMGFGMVGIVGPDRETPSGPWLGDLGDAMEVVRTKRATGALLVSSAIPSDTLNSLSRQLLDAGVHVHICSGLRGFAADRLRMVPMAYEPILYLEPANLTGFQLKVKRGIDVLAGAVAALLAAPVLLAAAAWIKLDDGGPVLFRQERVGKDGETFHLLKLRTMVMDADARLADLSDSNQRQGPLFKVSHDPRITRPGRLLRATSIDELPQLWNVLTGTMSLVGPRPALPDETKLFDEELQTRTKVPPGITGLWQVEARDNPAFGPYRRLDLFYVENWSISLDISILLTTVVTVLARAARAAVPGGGQGTDEVPQIQVLD